MSTLHGKDPYQILGVSSTASQRQIRRAYLALVKQHHPDRGGNAAEFDAITKAFNQVSSLDSVQDAKPQAARTARANQAPTPPPGATTQPVQFIPPLSEGPLRVASKPPVSVDALLAQQVVHGSIGGGFLRRKRRKLHASLSEILQQRVCSSLPAVRIFHGVKLSRKITLDTVVLGGTKVAVLAADFAAPDVYQFTGSQLVGQRTVNLTDLTEAVAGLQQLLPNVEIGGFSVVFSTNPHAPTIQSTTGLNTLGLTEAPASIMDAVRNLKLFIGTGQHHVVDRKTMGHLLSKL